MANPEGGGAAGSSARRRIVFLYIFLSTMTLRFISYNPMYASGVDRLEDITHSFPHEHCIALQGTGRRSGEFPVVNEKIGTSYVAYHWGWSKSLYSNKSAGISILVSSQF